MSNYHGEHYKQNTKNNCINWALFAKIIGTILTIVTIIVAWLQYKESVTGNKNSIIVEKPSINLTIDYLDDQSRFIDKITFNTNDTSLVQSEIKVEPFLDIIFYLPNKNCLIREILPIYNFEKINPQFMPYNLDFFNTNYGKLAEVSFNDNSYSIISNFYDLCSNLKYTSSYDKILPEIFGECIITSISLEMYIIVDYSDKFANQYKDIYLCTTGHCGFTANVTDVAFETNTSINKDILDYNIHCAVSYSVLKLHMENPEFLSELKKIQENDIIFESLNDFFVDIIHKNGMINYVVNMNEKLPQLISDAYTQKQLLFILTEEEPYWQIWK